MSEAELSLKEVEFLKEQIRNVAESEPFKSFEEGKSILESTAPDGTFYEEQVNQAVELILGA